MTEPIDLTEPLPPPGVGERESARQEWEIGHSDPHSQWVRREQERLAAQGWTGRWVNTRSAEAQTALESGQWNTLPEAETDPVIRELQMRAIGQRTRIAYDRPGSGPDEAWQAMTEEARHNREHARENAIQVNAQAARMGIAFGHHMVPDDD